MPLYRMFCIAAHYPDYKHIKSLVTQSANLVLDNGGTVRDIKSLGTSVLPHRVRRFKIYHKVGDYWTMNFDASPVLMNQLHNQMRQDPRVLRWTMLKIGEKLEDIIDTPTKTVRERFSEIY